MGELLMTLVVVEETARAAHEANRAYCLALGDATQVHWEDAPEWQRESARKGVEAFLTSGGTLTPEQSHEGWLEEKRATGWRHGPTKDAAKREHPCFLPYAELPAEQRAKDGIFLGVCRAMAIALGVKLSAEAFRLGAEVEIDGKTFRIAEPI